MCSVSPKNITSSFQTGAITFSKKCTTTGSYLFLSQKLMDIFTQSVEKLVEGIRWGIAAVIKILLAPP
jgi:hypothetical protein